jgi:hypothetical protein
MCDARCPLSVCINLGVVTKRVSWRFVPLSSVPQLATVHCVSCQHQINRYQYCRTLVNFVMTTIATNEMSGLNPTRPTPLSVFDYISPH